MSMIKIGEGSGRKVYDLGNGYVLKEPYSETGLQQNETELHVYNNAIQFREYLCPTFKGNDHCNTMIKVDLITLEEFNLIKTNPKIIEVLSYLYENFGLNDDINHYKSWGKLNGKYVLLDYGYTNELFNEIMFKYTGDIQYLT